MQIKGGLIELREKRQEIVKFYSDKVCKGVLDKRTPLTLGLLSPSVVRLI